MSTAAGGGSGDDVALMLDKMESAMGAMELAMQRARAEDRQGSASEREALVTRVQQELRTVMAHLPPPVRERISPAHPTMFRTLTQELDAEKRDFIENWADGVRKHGAEFEQWVQQRNQGDKAFLFLSDASSADARYYQACVAGSVPGVGLQQRRTARAAAGAAGAPAASSARRTPQPQAQPQRRRAAAKRQDVFARLASPPRANAQRFVASGRLSADGEWKAGSPRAGAEPASQAASRLGSPRRTTARSALKQRKKAEEDAARHRERLASPRRAKAPSPPPRQRSPPRAAVRARATGTSSARYETPQARLERLSSPSRGVRGKVTSPSRTRAAWIIAGAGSTADVGAPDLHSLEQLHGDSQAADGTEVDESRPSTTSKRFNKRFLHEQSTWQEQRDAKLRRKRQEMDLQREQEMQRHEADRLRQQQQRARRRVALGVEGGGGGKQPAGAKDFSVRSQDWLATRQQAIDKKRQQLEKSDAHGAWEGSAN
jgi:hypothetical protein